MDTEELNALKYRAYNIAVEHGFHKDIKADAYYLGIVMSEAGEAINADRKGRHANTKGFTDFMKSAQFYFRLAFDSYIKGSVEEKLANIVIRLLEFAGMKRYELNIESIDHIFSRHTMLNFYDYKLPGILVRLIAMLADASNEDELHQYVSTVLSDGFERMTGSNKDLWWFVERKIGYNEVLPKFDGEIY